MSEAAIKRLLQSTAQSYRAIAATVGCCHQNVARIAVKHGLNTKERNAAARARCGMPKLRAGKYPGVSCPQCNSTLLLAWDRRANRYGTQRFKCKNCGRKFLPEYKWITTGDRDRHLAVICRSSGYSRPDNSTRLSAYWARYRATQVWPYLSNWPNGDADLLKTIAEIVPRTLPEHIRADVCQEAAVAILEGRTIELKMLLRQWFKDNTIAYQALSLDGPSISHEGKTLGEALGIA